MDAKGELRKKLEDLQEKYRIYNDAVGLAQKEAKRYHQEALSLSKKVSGILREMRDIQRALDNPSVPLSNHAIMRYAERKHGVKLEGIEEELRTVADEAGVGAQVALLGDGKYPGKDITFVVKGGVVVTIY